MKKNIRTITSAIITAAVLLSPEGSLPVMASDAGDLVQRVEFDDTASDPVNTTNYVADDSAESTGTSTDLYNTSSRSSYRTLTDGNVTVSGMFPEDVTMTAEDDKDLYSWIAGDGQRVLFAYDVTFKQDGLFYIPDDSDLEYTIAADGYVPSEQKNAHVYHVNGDTKTEVTDASYMDDTAFTTAESGVFVCVADKPAGKAVQVKRTAAVTGPKKAPSGTLKYSGTSGGVSWAITSDGVLDIWPTNGTSGTFKAGAFNAEIKSGGRKLTTPWMYVNGTGNTWGLDIVKSAKVESGVSFASGESAASMFACLRKCTSIDLSGLNTANAVSMQSMFDGCHSLTSITYGSGFQTGNVTNMREMFWECNRLASLAITKRLNTRNVTNMIGMFAGCSSLTSLDVSGFDTGNVTNMSGMFAGCSSLTSLDVSGFNTGKVTNMSYMFASCLSLPTLDLSNFDTGNVTDMAGMFYEKTTETHTDSSVLKSIIFGTGFKTGNVQNMQDMFAGCSSLTSLDVSGFDTGNVTNMSGMFAGCSSLTSLDVSKFQTRRVTEMASMFRNCSRISTLNLRGFYTIHVTDMYAMFSGCRILGTIFATDQRFTTSSVTSSDKIFEGTWYLTGGNGTTFITDDVTYAKVDKPGTKGYLTDKIYIHLDANGGNDLNPGYVAIEYEGTLGTLPAPTWTDHTFVGWYTSKDGGTKADPDSKVTKSTTYYAHWTETPKTCTVTWDANGGSVSPATTSVAFQDPVGELPTPTRSNYTFDGWYTAKTGGTKVTSGDTISKDVTYYARWSATTYPITYNLDGGAMTGGTNPDIYSVETPTFTLKNPTKDGYTFAGWTGSNGTTPQTSVTVAKGSTGVRSYTAHWTRNTYTVTVPASVELTRIHDAACGADNYQAEIPIKVTGTVPSSGVTVTTEDGTIHRNDNDKITTALKIVSNKSLKWTTASDTAKNAMASAHITRAGEHSGSVTISFDSN